MPGTAARTTESRLRLTHRSTLLVELALRQTEMGTGAQRKYLLGMSHLGQPEWPPLLTEQWLFEQKEDSLVGVWGRQEAPASFYNNSSSCPQAANPSASDL